MATEDTGEKFHLPIYELQWKAGDGWEEIADYNIFMRKTIRPL